MHLSTDMGRFLHIGGRLGGYISVFCSVETYGLNSPETNSPAPAIWFRFPVA